MHTLMISLDTLVLTQAIGNSRVRHERYAELAGRVSMVICNRSGSQPLTPYERGALAAIPTESRGHLAYLQDGYRQGLRVHQQHPVDVVTAQDPFLTGVIALRLGRTLRRPVIVQIVSPVIDNLYFARERLRNRALQHLARWLIRQADAVRVLSEAERQACLRHGVAPQKVCVLPVPADLRQFFTPVSTEAWARRLNLSPDDLVLLWIARPVPFKDGPLLLRAFQRVHRQMPTARLVLVGDASHTALPALAAALGIADAVRWAGNVTHDHLPALYQLATLYTHSSYYEGLGVVMLEAHASGLPIVSTATDGAREIVLDGQTGLITPIRDAEGLANGILTLLRDPIRRSAMGIRARQHVQEKFDDGRLTRAWVTLWQRLAEGKPPCDD